MFPAFIQKKIINESNFREILGERHRPLVWTNGCFDIIHRGHIEYLAECKAMGGQLIVGVNSDDSIRRLKGEGRPIIEEEDRVIHLASFSFIDYVLVFEEDTPFKWIERIQPDVLIKGGDYAIDDIVGREVVEGNGGRVATVPLVEGKSTSLIIESILKNYG
ncbi:D-glycero-beta-D-manno-heptose 1-phosphate adenylyltransferase [Membranihabitans marinus]|uniref:D-glycero-beta-D-manno-heptose 1-phosphate adenylyltransferase n=1 Tax=Membranihabitans marinus TaxID=1227546 RepID=UPI001F02245D|nr:D-glycero-beta-D-manno-heptose 1-phosphate adenylyltransferase [Membranihabitans marinus]